MAGVGKVIAPVLKPTGFADRWETVAAIVPSIAAKEVVVGFMAQVLELPEDDGDNTETTFAEDTKEQIAAFGGAVKDSVSGIISFDIGSLFAAPDAEEVEEREEEYGSHRKSWQETFCTVEASSFMVFILLVVPCAVTLGAIKQEFGNKFLFKVIGIMLVVPYVAWTFIFQSVVCFFKS